MILNITASWFAMKPSKRFLVATLPLIAFSLGMIGMFMFLRFYSQTSILTVVPIKHRAVEQPIKSVVVPGMPVRLKIPKIHVDAAIESLGLTPQGDLDAPKGYENAGWYNAGPRPGADGSAVIDGHFGRAGNKPAVFDDLHTLQPGDLLYVEDDKKDMRTFVVIQLISYGKDDDASNIFRSRDGKAHLNLITCQGTWSKNQAEYSNRLVVFADQVVEEIP